MYIFTAHDRLYASWSTDPAFPGSVDPVSLKLLTGDEIDADGSAVHRSPYRDGRIIPGVLCLSKGTHGRKGKRMLYTCVPFDKTLPVFLVPYASKKPSFDKNPVDLYILMKFQDWEGKRPNGISTQTLGEVSSLPATYDFLCHAHQIHVPIQKLTRAAFNAIRSIPGGARELEKSLDGTSPEKRPGTPRLMTIDPPGATDLDDAIGAIVTKKGEYIVDVAITDPSYWLDELDLWQILTEKVATVYLPDLKKPMLPAAALSDGLCSLKAGVPRPCLVLRMVVGRDGRILREKMMWESRTVHTNEVYESPKLLESSLYRTLQDVTRLAAPVSSEGATISDSHEVVAFWMKCFNICAAKALDKLGTGIFRTGPRAPPTIGSPPAVPAATRRISEALGAGGGAYTTWENRKAHGGIHHQGHWVLYAQSSSPIRRVVDLVNIICLTEGLELRVPSSGARAFRNKWIGNVAEIQRYTRAARRVQSQCELLALCAEARAREETEFEGYTISRDDCCSNGRYKYLVHVPRLLNLVRAECTEEVGELERVRLRLHLFLDEATMAKKVRVTMLPKRVLSGVDEI